MATDNPVITRINEWGEKRADIRAIVMSSSRINPNAQDLVDLLSDYDLDIIIDADARTLVSRPFLVGGYGQSNGRLGRATCPGIWD